MKKMMIALSALVGTVALQADNTAMNLAFMDDNGIESTMLDGIVCKDGTTAIQAHDFPAACGDWAGDPMMAGCCARLVSLGHCLMHGGGLDLVNGNHVEGIAMMMEGAAQMGKGPDEVVEGITMVADNPNVQAQLSDGYADGAWGVEVRAVNAVSQ